VKEPYPLKIDAYSHIVPPAYAEVLKKTAPKHYAQNIAAVPPLYDLDRRFRTMDRYEGLVQVLTLGWPSVEEIANPKKAEDLARRANDAMAELVRLYPDRFVAAVATLPLNNMDAALAEVDRAFNDLRLRGILLYTPVNDKPLDSPEFMPLYEKMSRYDLPIVIHPTRGADYADYRTEKRSKYRIFSLFGWVYETTVAMTRLVLSGTMEKYPNLKFLTHHCGGMVPYLQERIKQFYDVAEMRRGERYEARLSKAPIEYFRMFYNDTALYGNASGLMCAYAFFGADRLLFAADSPLGDVQLGNRNYRQTINAIEAMDIGDEDRKKIYEDNARKLFCLPV